jgi:CBS domain-containing protein
MSTPAVTVTPETPVKHAAELIAGRGFTLLPVVDGSLALVGVVSEGDLVVDRFPRDARWSSDRRVAEPAGVVGEVMTERVVTASPVQDVRELLSRMRSERVRAVPVCDQDSVIGVVTCQDLVRVLARADDQIAADVRRRLAIYTTPGRFATDVRDGAVVLTDRMADRDEWHTIRGLAEQIPGVVRARVVAAVQAGD